ncbi:gene transfer agent family protein, partial [Bradyrhizobium sp. NBAIM08]|uniref:gene transfer agent family protein n=1 Tax=Bradyrhizobium sp. NBAIM08 TaxID=2793815 RepID=UPI001CD1B36D
IERFEEQYSPFGVFGLWDQLMGRGEAPQVRHVRDLVALGLVGGGLPDREADAVVAALPPSENLRLRSIAKALLGVTFLPIVLSAGKKKEDGSRRRDATPSPDGAPASES